MSSSTRSVGQLLQVGVAGGARVVRVVVGTGRGDVELADVVGELVILVRSRGTRTALACERELFHFDLLSQNLSSKRDNDTNIHTA